MILPRPRPQAHQHPVAVRWPRIIELRQYFVNSASSNSSSPIDLVGQASRLPSFKSPHESRQAALWGRRLACHFPGKVESKAGFRPHILDCRLEYAQARRPRHKARHESLRAVLQGRRPACMRWVVGKFEIRNSKFEIWNRWTRHLRRLPIETGEISFRHYL